MLDFINLKNLSIFLAAYFLGLFVQYYAQTPSLDSLQKIVSIVSSLSIIIALSAYFYKKNQDRVLAAIDQASFFRDKIINKNNELISHAQLKNSNYIFAKVTLEVPTIKQARETQLTACQKQSDLLKGDQKVMDLQGEVLNMLEEFALRVIYSKTEKHPALYSIRHAFVTAVEMNAVYLLMQREVFLGNNLYPAILKLYNIWNVNIDRRSSQERLVETLNSFE